jgi:putative tryptophan/tyrosine transport system substrate-binding protein
MLDGRKDGLRELGLEDGRHYVLEVRNLQGDLRAAAEAARALERGGVRLIYGMATSVTVAVKEATTEVPIVFSVGRDPVEARLVESFAKPVGRLTGVHFLSSDLTAKRLELVKTARPDMRRAMTFYKPNNPTAQESARLAREAAQRLRAELIERYVDSPEALREALLALKPQEADAHFYTNEAMVASHSQVIGIAPGKKLPTVFSSPTSAKEGALLAYGVSYREAGRLSAKYVQRVLTGTRPRDLPVESFNKPTFVINLKVARELGITIARPVLLQADAVIE